MRALTQIDDLQFNERGLIPAIAQDQRTGEVRMMAWMNAESIAMTLRTRKATFFSRSRQKLWVKGEGSGNLLHVVTVKVDCDQDAILLLCEPAGPTCHTGADNCFIHSFEGEPELQAFGATS